MSCWFYFKQKTAYEMRISDWSSDVCTSDLAVDIGEGDVVEEDGEQILPVDVARQRHRVRIVAERERAILDTDLFYRREEQLLKRDPGLSDLDFANLGPPVGTHDQQSRSDRKSVEEGKSVSVRVNLGGGR